MIVDNAQYAYIRDASKTLTRTTPMIDLTALLAAAITVLGVVVIYAALVSVRP